MTKQHKYGSTSSAGKLIASSIAVIGVISVGLFFLSREEFDPGEELRVYCAAGIRLPVEAVAKNYEKEMEGRVRVVLDYASSGTLLSKIGVRSEGDLYIPADDDFVNRGRKQSLFAESLPLAVFRLVIAVKPGNPKKIQSLRDLLRDDIDFVMCNETAGAGKKARKFLKAAGLWKEFEPKARVFKPTVTDAASVLQTSSAVQASLIWDATARQFGLDVVEVPEFKEARGDIQVAVLNATKQPTAALAFARYLSSPEKGQPLFAQFGYESIPGDKWEPRPDVRVYYGGVNRNAVKETLAAFAKREGCSITEVPGGCGVLVGQIQTAPEGRGASMFLTCDASYMDKVQDLFLQATDVSETKIVMLVRKDNEIEISKIQDLAKPGVKLGITDPRASALGDLSVELMKELNLWSAVEKNVRVRSPTAHELISQMLNKQSLDVALVYEANCQNLPPSLGIIPLEHPHAKAVQNMAASKSTPFPFLVSRLMSALRSPESKTRFLKNGFSWRAVTESADVGTP
ncbi:MAG: substrate-binding domain-containing protein [Planctomycetota bacterium]